MHISIVTGTTTTQLADAPVFKFDRATVGILGQQVTITPAIDVEVPQDRYVGAINGVASNDNGEFFIDGSACDSWMLGTESGNGWVDDGHTISIVDLCPACTTCESIYRLQYEAENLKMWVNTLKDVNLYNQTDMEQRRTNLLSLRATGSTASMALCSNGLDPDDAYMQIKSAQLMQQYMTVVHMWNYVVSQNNSSNEITIAPEDTAGFVVQTKRALTSCAKQQDIQCCIDVGAPTPIYDNGIDTGLPSEYPISIYVPDGSLEFDFEPFDQKEGIALQGATVYAVSLYGSNTKHVYTKQIEASIAGTYVVTAKFLPFVAFSIWKEADGQTIPISIRGGTTVPISGQTTGDEITWDFGISGHTSTSLLSPTEQDYLTAKTTPTCSVNFKLSWPIHITWIIDGESKTEDYVYVANGIRIYYGDTVISGSTIPVIVPVEPEEPST